MAKPASALHEFIHPLIGQPAWGVRQGYGSFLLFDFGQPRLIVRETTRQGRLSRDAHATGEWYLWIYCCHWRAFADHNQLAESEDDRTAIDGVCARLNGQNLVEIVPDGGRTMFRFDLGGSVETRPYDDRPNLEQWMIMTETETFAYRGDGYCSRHGNTAVPETQVWLPLT